MSKSTIIPAEIIEKKIYFLRKKKVMLDSDLAELYGVQTKVLNQAIKRNFDRFPDDFMFQLTKDEYILLRSQIVTLKQGRGQHRKYLPFVFTEQGVAMLSSVLNSKRAIYVNIQIMRTFVKLRELLASHKELADRLSELEQKYDTQFKMVFEAIYQLMTPSEKLNKKIGFDPEKSTEL